MSAIDIIVGLPLSLFFGAAAIGHGSMTGKQFVRQDIAVRMGRAAEANDAGAESVRSGVRGIVYMLLAIGLAFICGAT